MHRNEHTRQERSDGALYLTFDIGTSGLKTALIADDGVALAVHTEEYTPLTPRPDWIEMSPDSYWNAAVAGARAALVGSGADASRIAAVGFSSQGQTFIPLDTDGRPLREAIVWVDNRAQSIADEWEANWLPKDEYRTICGYPWVPAGLTLFKIAWLARHEPRSHKAWKFLCLPDYLIYRMTGATVTDRVIALMSGMYDLRTGDWSGRLLDAAGISSDQLPEILELGSVAGRMTALAAAELGVPVGTPVCVGANDQLSGAIGAGNVRPGIVTETTGTALALVVSTPSLLDDATVCVGRHAVPGLSYVLSFANTSAIVLKWFRDMCSPGEGYDSFLADVESVPAGCDGLTVVPHFAGGSGAPTHNADARGAMAGLTLGHTRTHIARAIMESCACMLQECLEPVTGHGLEVDTVRSLGGAARSDVWLQMKADLLGIPVERPACSDAASLGAAALAAAGIGQYPSVQEASEAWYRSRRTFEPNPAMYAVYREVYARYKDLYHRLYG